MPPSEHGSPAHPCARPKEHSPWPAERHSAPTPSRGQTKGISAEAPAQTARYGLSEWASTGYLRGCHFRRKNGFQNLAGKLVGRGFDLMPRLGGLCFDGLTGSAYTLLRRQTGAAKCRIALGIPLLQPLLAPVEDLGPGGAQFRLVLLGFGIGGSDGGVSLLDRALGALAALGEHAHERAIQQVTIGDHQENKQDDGRHRAEHKIADLR